MISLDHNATTPLAPECLELVERIGRTISGNPSSLHGLGRAARRVVEEARERVAVAVSCEPREVVFTSSATEANNLAIHGLLEGATGQVLVNPMEHKSVLSPLAACASPGLDIVQMPVLEAGVVDAEAVAELMNSNVQLVICQAANNETGCLQPLSRLSDLCAEFDVPLFVDAAQAPGRMGVTGLLRSATAATFSSHKIYGPKGAGALLLRAETALAPQVTGGAQERGHRAGTENVASLAGFGLAMERAVEDAPSRQSLLAALEAELWPLVNKVFPASRLNGEGARRLPGVMNICVPGVSAESLMMNLDMAGFAVSVGSACSSGSTEPSHVLHAMGLSLLDNHSSVRFSLSHLNTAAELGRLAEALRVIAKRL